MRTGVKEEAGEDLIKISEKQPLYKLMEQFCPTTEKYILRAMIGEQY
jgi:hypothetical protein